MLAVLLPWPPDIITPSAFPCSSLTTLHYCRVHVCKCVCAHETNKLVRLFMRTCCRMFSACCVWVAGFRQHGSLLIWDWSLTCCMSKCMWRACASQVKNKKYAICSLLGVCSSTNLVCTACLKHLLLTIILLNKYLLTYTCLYDCSY